MEKVKISHLGEKNIGEFVDLFRAVLSTDFEQYSQKKKAFFLRVWTEKEIKERLAKKTRLILVASLEGKMVGFLVAKVWAGGVSSLQWIGVKKEHQGRETGSALLRFWEEAVREKGCHKLRARTTEGKTKSFYFKNGFNLEGILKNDSYHLDQYFYGKVIKKND